MKPTTIGPRIAVVGTSGSGKTTLAKQLAAHLNCLHIELDALHWEPNWTAAPEDVLRERVDRATSGERWVLDGNYSRVQPMIWSRADTLIWLDYALPLIFWRLTKRTLRRFFMREQLWNGNRERLYEHFIPSKSLFVWAYTSRRRRAVTYPQALAQPEYAHLTVIRLYSPRELEVWLCAALPNNAIL